MPDRSLFRRLIGSVRTASFEREMAAELATHIEFEVDALVAHGWNAADARVEAHRRFGSLAQTADLCRDSWGLRALETIGQDLRQATRAFIQSPGCTLLMLLTVAVGVGLTTAVFSAVHAVLLQRLPYANGDALVEIRQQKTAGGAENLGLSLPELADYRTRMSSFDGVAEYHQMWFNLIEAHSASRVMTGVVSAGFFDVLGVRPLLGRTFAPADDAPDAAPVLVLSHAFWRDALGADPGVVGRTFEMNDRVHRVVGVLPAMPQFPEANDVYMPVSACPFHARAAAANDRSMRMVSAIARMKPGVPVAAARHELGEVAGTLAAARPDAYPAGLVTSVVSVRDQLTAGARPTLMALMAASLCVLLLVCANVANLTLSRLVPRERELMLRRALGASPGRLVRQLAIEAALVASAGGALGLALAAAGRAQLASYTLRFTPRAAEISFDRTVVLFAIGTTIVTALIFGLLPALRVSRAPIRLNRHGARRSLIVPQIAVSFVLLAISLQMTRDLIALLSSDAGFRVDHVLTARVDLDWVRYATGRDRRAFYRRLLSALGALPGARQAALSTTFPLDDSWPLRASMVTDDGEDAAGEAPSQVDVRLASAGYFDALGMSVLRGRSFATSDSDASPEVAIVNGSMARRHFGGRDPVGRRVSLDGGGRWITIVGVVNDVKHYGLDTSAVDEVYVPFDQRAPLSATLLVRTSDDPASVRQGVEEAVRAIDPRQPVSRVQTLDHVRDASLAPARTTTALVSWLAAIALFIAAAGVAGTVWFSVNQRSREMGVRIALGESPARLAIRIVGDALVPVVAGVAAGVPVALAAVRWFGGAGDALRAVGPWAIGSAVTTILAVAVLACLAPARRAAAIDPIHALRAE